MRLSLKTIALGTTTTPPMHILPRLSAEMFQSWCTFHSVVGCERPFASTPTVSAEHQDLKHIVRASLHRIVHSGAQCPQVPSGVIILREAINICRAGAEVAPPRVLARVVEAQRIDGLYRRIWNKLQLPCVWFAEDLDAQ